MRSYLVKIAALLIAPTVAIGAATPNSGNSSVILSIWNDGISGVNSANYQNDRSLTVDTGKFFSDLVVYNSANAGSITIDIDALVSANTSYTSVLDVFDETLSGSTYMQLTAFDGQMTGGHIAGDYAMLTTYNGASPVGTNVQLTSSITNADTYYGFIGSDGVEVTTEESAAQPNAESENWGDNFGGQWSQITNAGAFSNADADLANPLTLNMAFVTTGGSGSNGGALDINTFGGSMTAAFSFTTGDLVITTAAVPVPAAVWLFGSAIAGLIGFSRRSSRVVTA